MTKMKFVFLGMALMAGSMVEAAAAADDLGAAGPTRKAYLVIGADIPDGVKLSRVSADDTKWEGDLAIKAGEIYVANIPYKDNYPHIEISYKLVRNEKFWRWVLDNQAFCTIRAPEGDLCFDLRSGGYGGWMTQAHPLTDAQKAAAIVLV